MVTVSSCALEYEPVEGHAKVHTAMTIRNGLRLNGLGSNGVSLNGILLNGVDYNSISLNSISLNSISLNSISLNGVSLNSISLNGIEFNSISLNSISLNSISLNSISLNSISLNSISLNGVDATEAEEAELEILFRYMTECALALGQCVTMYDSDGAPLEYCGVEGLDTGWAQGAPDPSKADVMAACVDRRASADGKVVVHHPVNRESFKAVLSYMVECALPEGDSATIYDEAGLPVAYHGALGLAPEWRDGPLSEVGQRKVSACLAARANALQQPVQISMRGAGITAASAELDLYDNHEGAFWGNLFAATPYIQTCLVDGGGLSGRVCAQSGSCGFEVLGDCATLCTSRHAADSSYSGCGGEDEVVNTFLALGNRVGFGVAHNCTRESDGSLWCWGRNDVGQLGTGAVSQQEHDPLPVTALGTSAAEVGAGHSYSCARKTDGTLWCWGQNTYGQLGDTTTLDRSLPVPVATLGDDVSSVGISERHACARKTDGTLWCWGKNTTGAVGDGTTTHRSTPVQVTSLDAAVAEVSAGSCAKSTCAIKNDGTLWCWGDNTHGQVGDGSTQQRYTPVRVAVDAQGSSFEDVTDVCNGAAHTCARKADGSVWCWGQNASYQLGNSNVPVNQNGTAPVQVALPGEAAPEGISCGCRHTCAVTSDSTLWCWGDNTTGALGAANYQPVTDPVHVSSLGNNVVRVSAADDHTCATKVDSSIWCWGEDEYNVLISVPSSSSPIQIDY